MFGLFKKKPPLPKPYADKRWFIQEVFDEIRKIEDPNEKLEKYVDVCERVRELEDEFGIECLELEFVRDDVRDAFFCGTDPATLYASALVYGILRDRRKEFKDALLSDLPDKLKARLLRTYILSELDEEKVDPMELNPSLQHAFHSVEERGLADYQKGQVLSSEFGIKGWRCRREMNPNIIYD